MSRSLDKFRRILSAYALAVWIFALFFSPAKAEEVDTSFAAQCPLLLAQADNFAHQCVLHARRQERFFSGEPEIHSALIGFDTSRSNFTLGCTLNSQGGIDFLGVYYTLVPSNFKIANIRPIAFIDFSGNFGVLDKSHLINFLAVRLFQTKSYSREYYYTPVKNCVSSTKLDGTNQDWTGSAYKAILHPEINSTDVQVIMGDYRVVDQKYIRYPKQGGTKIVMTDAFFSYFILNDGGILVERNQFNSTCQLDENEKIKSKPLQTNYANIFEELCFEKSLK